MRERGDTYHRADVKVDDDDELPLSADLPGACRGTYRSVPPASCLPLKIHSERHLIVSETGRHLLTASVRPRLMQDRPTDVVRCDVNRGMCVLGCRKRRAEREEGICR